MLDRIKQRLAVVFSAFALAMPLLAAVPVSAATPAQCAADPSLAGCTQTNIDTSLKCGSNVDIRSNPDPSCADVSEQSGRDLNSKIRQVLNILSAIVGVIAVIMIIFGGLRYVASGGKQESVSAAKNTILYAVIGLVIVALAQAIVHFVLRSAT